MVDLQRVAFDQPELARIGLLEFAKRGKAAAIHLDRGNPRSGAQQRPGETSRARPDLEHRPVRQTAGNGGDPVEQALVEKEVLPQRA